MFSILSRSSIRYIRSVSKLVVCSCSTKNDSDQINRKTDDILGSIATKYQVFRNEDSKVILDVNEESFATLPVYDIEEEVDQYEGLNLERGMTGVYEIEDLVQVLQRENAQNIFVASVPPELKYVDYICVVSGRSTRHMTAIAHFVRKLFKIKRNSTDILPKIEGKDSTEWMAMDLGNIALHIFSNEARVKYDLDSLWAVGEEYDEECNKPDDPIVQMLQQHSIYLRDLEPADKT